MTKPILFIGIDPAFRNNGFCICFIDFSDRTVKFLTMKNGFVCFSKWIAAASDRPCKIQNDVFICVENSNLQNITFKKSGNWNVDMKISRDVGKNQGTSQNTVDACVGIYDNVYDISPADKGAKITDEKIFQSIVKSENLTFCDASKIKKTSQDERDAFMLAIKIHHLRKFKK